MRRFGFIVVLLALLLAIGGVTVYAEPGEAPATSFSFVYTEENTDIPAGGDSDTPTLPMTGDTGCGGWIVALAVSGACLIATMPTVKKHKK